MGINEERYGEDVLTEDDFPVVGDAANLVDEDEEWEEEDFEEENEIEVDESGGQFVIERTTPPPPSSKRKYPFDKMRIGDSFEVRVRKAMIEEKGLPEALRLTRSALSSSASAFNRRNDDRRMVVRKTGDTTLRCWCVDPDY